jgi:hypothetical protein
MYKRIFEGSLILLFILLTAILLPSRCESSDLKDLKGQASSFVGKSAQEVERIWGTKHGFNSVSERGVGVIKELWTYHFLKKDGEAVIDKYVSMSGNPETGAFSMRNQPYAPEVLENYWVFDVYIEHEIVQRIELRN